MRHSLDGDVYAGTSVDFMGINAAIFRTSIGTGGRHLRTEAYDHNWLNGNNLTHFVTVEAARTSF